MLRRTLLVVPLIAVAAALGGMAAGPPAVAVALVAGIAGALLISVASERRVEGVTDKVLRFPEGRPGEELDIDGSPAWQRLVVALNLVSDALADQMDALVTERVRAQRLLEELPLAVALFTEEGLAYANPVAIELFGETGSAASPAQFLPAELAEAVSVTATTGEPTKLETQVAGRELIVRTSRPAEGEVALVGSDVTDVRRVEAMRRDFVTNASHELKTPVAAMQALADSLVLAVDRDPDRARTMIARLRGESVRLARLVRDLLDLARFEEATNQRAGRVDLTEVLASQRARLAELASSRGIQVDVHADGPLHLVAVPDQIRVIVGNLLENAVRYNRDGGRVDAYASRENAHLRLVVTDTGIGIPESEQERIFERFYRVDKGRSRTAGGTGLGLSLVRNATERQGGSVRVDSIPGEGSTFVVELPVEGAGAYLPKDGGTAARHPSPLEEVHVSSQERQRFPVQPSERHETAKSSDDIAAESEQSLRLTESQAGGDPRTTGATGADTDTPEVPPHRRSER